MDITIDRELEERLRALAKRLGQEPNQFAVGALTEALEWHEDSPSIPEGSPEEKAALHEGLEDFAAGWYHRFDPAAALKKHGIAFG